MKENILDVLMYLFENYMNDDVEVDKDEEALRVELQQAGFHQRQISKAFDWLEGLTDLQDRADVVPSIRQSSIRVYTHKEREKLNTDCRGFLQFLENVGVLDNATREMVVDRVMALDTDEVDMDQLKWVVLMVLFNQPGREEAYAWMEDLVFDENAGNLH
jgi:Smg protein